MAVIMDSIQASFQGTWGIPCQMSSGNPGCSLVAQSDTLRPASQSESSIYGMYGHAAPATLGWTCHQNVTKPFALAPSLLWASGWPSVPWWPDETKRFSDHVKLLLKKCQIPPSQLEALAAGRLVWRDVCKDGLTTFSINYDQEAEARRLRHHTISSPPTAGPRCHICDRICASDFGLRSHLRIHNRPSSTS